MPHQDLISQSAIALVARLRAGEITPHDCLDALEARIATLSALVAAGDRMEALAERFAARCEAWRTYALAVNVLRLSEGCVEEEEYARLHEEHARAWQAVLAVEPEAARR